MTIEENKTLVWRYIHISEDFDHADEILAPDFVDHSHPEFRPGPEDLKQNLIDFHNAFPDASITIEEMIGEGDIIAFRFVLRGTHTGTLWYVNGII
jgi:predicted ester cyclase